MADNWVPLSVRTGADSDYDALYEGIPDWLQSSLWSWAEGHLQLSRGGWSRSLLEEIERRFRRSLGLHGEIGESQAVMTLQARMSTDPKYFLDIVDFLVHKYGYEDELEELLSQAGSAWRAVSRNGSRGLERRVPEAIAEAAEQIMSTTGRAGQHLAAAWQATYGREPNPSEAYRETVKAVEVVAAPVITPKDPTPTLGKMITAFRDGKGKWELALKPTAIDPHDAVLGMMQLLWFSQHDRHGTSDTDQPMSVELDEAETALHLGMTLVQWFASGAVRVK